MTTVTPGLDFSAALGFEVTVTVGNSDETPKLTEVRELAEKLMVQHGLAEWTLGFDGAKRRAGFCCEADSKISLSAPLMEIWDMPDVQETILHEIAHAKAGPGHGHDYTWQLTCIRVGANPERCYDSDERPGVRAKYTGTCAAGHLHYRERASKREHSCSKCYPRFDQRFLITWELTP
jgi:predicted SprT family Zn-dependent metalloprotease